MLLQRVVGISLSLWMACSAASAAQITSSRTDAGYRLIEIGGDIEQGDAEKFATVAKGDEGTMVMLWSYGGSLQEGLAIGRIIHKRGFYTVVPPGGVCASSCALAWAAGAERYMAEDALIGFHAAWVEDNGKQVTSGAGNALAGAYMAEIGFNEQAIVFATSAGPDGMTWLSPASAESVGIALHVVDKNGSEIQSQPSSLQLPKGYLWIILASARHTAELPAKLREGVGQYRSLIVSTANGYVAAVIGPFTEADAHTVLSMGITPADAYLSTGKNFTAQMSR